MPRRVFCIKNWSITLVSTVSSEVNMTSELDIVIIVWNDFLPPSRRGSHVKSDYLILCTDIHMYLPVTQLSLFNKLIPYINNKFYTFLQTTKITETKRFSRTRKIIAFFFRQGQGTNNFTQ